MDKEPTTFNLNPEKLANLLLLGSDIEKTQNSATQDEKKSELLHDRLESSLPNDSQTEKILPNTLGEIRNTINLLISEPIGKLLQNTGTDITVIRKIKDYGKRLSISANSDIELETANTIYYAAIGFCLVNHNHRITKFSYKDLEHYFSLLSTKIWIPQYLRNLFLSASQYCSLRKNN